jgi:uncharacterized caspase-like protein
VALLYGVSDYNGGIKKLAYPALDVEALAPLLSTSTGGIFAVTARVDAKATKAQMQVDIAAAASSLTPDSLFVFYFGGHGIQGASGTLGTDGHASIAPYGIPTEPIYSTASMVTEDELRSWLTVLPTKKIIVILDACFSGGFITMAGGNDGVPQDSEAYYQALWTAYLAGKAPQAGDDLTAWFHYITTDALTDNDHTSSLASWTKALAAGSGFAADQAQLLTAAGSLEESDDSDAAHNFQHGVFTYFLLEAKDKADFDGNGYVTVSEAYRYAFDAIQAQWAGVWGAVGYNGFVTNPGNAFLPHLSQGPADYILFKK